MSSKRSYFRAVWLDDVNFAPWLQQVKDDSKGYCKLCKKTFDLSNMGIGAVKSHMKSKQHQQVLKEKQSPLTQPITKFMGENSKSSDTLREASAEQAQTSSAISTSNTAAVPNVSLVVSEDVLHAEVLWVLKVIASHYSFNSSKDISQLFSKMFSDSQIAQSFSCGATKCAYLTCFGIYPYFHELLLEKVQKVRCYSISFDETLNQFGQKKQMDLIVRFWDSDVNKVTDRYFTSEFLGHATAADLLMHFKNGTSSLNPSCLVQLSMDGPNVNWKFYRDFSQERQAEELPELLNIGSCGLHIVHGSFQKGAKESGWDLANILRSLWQIFHDSPARREDFTKITGTSVFPLQFCQHRWVEDVKVAERALQIWPHVDKYVKTLVSQGKAPPTSVSFFTVQTACDDPLFQAKLEFFVSVARPLQDFLIMFQKEAPMVPFLGVLLKELLSAVMSRFLKKDILEKADTFKKLAMIDPADKKNQKSPKQVELGFAARETLRKVSAKKAASELRILAFQNDCMKFLSAIAAKLLEKCPLKYSLIQCLLCVIPKNLASTPTEATTRFERVLRILLNGKWRSADQCDEILTQYKAFVIEVRQNHLAEFLNFDMTKERLDEFYWKYMKDQKYVKLWDVLLMIFTLSHGQATVERGFSVNSEMLSVNMAEKTTVACRFVYDTIKGNADHFSELPFTPRLKRNVRAARMRYQLYLEDQRKLTADEEKSSKRKAMEDDIHAAESKRKILKESVESMRKEADKLAVSAEETLDFTLLAKSNAFRQKILEKEEEEKKLSEELHGLHEKLKFME